MLYQDTYNLSDLTGEKLLQFIDYAADGRLRVEKREGEPGFVTCSSVNEILDMKAGEILEVLLYDLDSYSYQKIKLEFYNSEEGEEEYTVKDCLDKGLWSVEYGPGCFKKERDGRSIPVYGEAYDSSDEEKFNCVEMTTTKFGKPDFYRSSKAFTYEQLELVYVKGEMALYTCSVLNKKDNVYYTNNGGYDGVVLTPSKNIVSVGELWEKNEFSQLRKVIDYWVCEYNLNSDYSHDWRTPDGVIEED